MNNQTELHIAYMNCKYYITITVEIAVFFVMVNLVRDEQISVTSSYIIVVKLTAITLYMRDIVLLGPLIS